MDFFHFINVIEDGYRTITREPGERAFTVVEENPFGDESCSGNSRFILTALEYKAFHDIPFVEETKTKKPADEQRAFFQTLEPSA